MEKGRHCMEDRERKGEKTKREMYMEKGRQTNRNTEKRRGK